MVVVTGATGHIGNVLVRKLVNEGVSVKALFAPGDNLKALLNMPVELIPMDILDYEGLVRAFKGADAVFHLAGLITIMPFFQKKVFRVNVEGTKNVIRACRKAGVKRLVYVSSVHALSEPEKGAAIDENFGFNVKKVYGCYGKSKALAGREVERAVSEGLDAVILCPSGVIGPYDYRGSEMGTLFRDFVRGKFRISVNGCFDFVDVRDVADGIIRAWKKGKSGEKYILSGHMITMKKLVALLYKYTAQKRKKIFFVPEVLVYPVAAVMTAYYWLSGSKPRFTFYSLHTLRRYYRFSHEKASRELGYFPGPIEETVKATLEWFTKEANTLTYNRQYRSC
ncbi:hypothetical protein AT15_00765 [Kosmotoga arenicorallina S304]|uniref:NAD-dependent epimerase/dehydratase domain-containing protein n=1 Tax=Kosmotoga arenicorallina S304 TaxID=1453497 RepID=A0A176K0D1_9BACT|nr:SDR family oxidoreductase [Kosmotoga arenicorallina]OAA30078.1 hypothetical protein AT15_00765 [Kosmotoga arenicorallina S304]